MLSDVVLKAHVHWNLPRRSGETFQTCSEKSDLNLSAVRISLNWLATLFTFSSLFSLI